MTGGVDRPAFQCDPPTMAAKGDAGVPRISELAVCAAGSRLIYLASVRTSRPG